MIQKHRIRTEIGKDQRLTVELKQDYDLLEILSLKFTQRDIYTSLCADYGVVCGRISVNDGVGVANARISIFVPLSDEDSDDPIVSELYPYTNTSDTSEEGYRYNLLPSRKQHSGHTPVGTFPDQEDILGREEVLEVYEKYYKYTVKTNDAGDFMIWGVPVGTQTVHVDVDLSDMGCNSLVPYDLVYEGISKEKFENMYTYMSSNNLDGLPQIVSFEKTVEVYPFWGNQDLCEIGITRTDFDLKEKGIRIEPYAIMMGGTFTDSGKDALRVNCNVDNQMGEKCRLTTFPGDIEAIRFSGQYEKNSDGTPNMGRPILEAIAIDSLIDENGVYFFRVPMNLKRMITNEFGEMEETLDQTKGIATKGNYRFRLSLNEDTGERNRFTGKFLIPNIREYHNGDSSYLGGPSTIDEKSYAFSVNLDDYPLQAIEEIAGVSQDAIDDNQLGIPQDYFYQFRYGRVYTASNFINQYYKKSGLESVFNFLVKDRNESFIGIKEIWPAEKDDCSNTNNYFPINDAVRNHRFNFFILTIVSFIEWIGLRLQLFFKELVAQILYAIAELLESTGVSNRAAAKMFKRAKEYQFKSIFKLQLITYPDCYDCEEDNDEGDVVANVDLISESDYPSITGGTYSSNQNFTERYIVASDNCATYDVSNSTGSQVSVNYNDCSGNSSTLTLNDGQSSSFNGRKNQQSTFTNAGLTVDNYVDISGGASYSPDTDLYFQQYTITPTAANQNPDDGDILFQTFLISIDIYGSGEEEYIPVGIGQPYQIVWDADVSSWKIIGLYGIISDTIAAAYNKPVDEPVNGTCHTTQGVVVVDKIWKVADIDPATVTFTEVESGCSKYDFIIEDESGRVGDMKLRPFISPLTGYGGNIIETYVEARNEVEDHQPKSGTFAFTPLAWGSTPMWAQYDTTANYETNIFGLNEVECEPRPPYNIMAVVSKHEKRAVYANVESFENNVAHCILNGAYYGKVKKKGPYWVDNDLTKDGTVSGYSEFRDGVFTIVPLAGRTGELLNSYRRRKLFGKLMCGGVVSYTFSNSWLNGALYFFQFMKRGSTRYCKDCLYRKVDENGVHYYYRSTPYSPNFTSNAETQYNYNSSGTQTGVNTSLTEEYGKKTKGFYGSRKGVLFPNNDLTITQVEINFPTTVVDLGPRNTWLKEVCVDPELDPNCSISRSIGSTSYKGLDDLMEYIIQSKEIKERGRLDVEDLFDARSNGKIDGDIAQLMNFNTQTGIYPFEFEESDSPYIDQYSTVFDSKGPIGLNFVYSEDDPDTPELEQAGELVRACLNEPGRLGDTSQKVPYFMWDTRGHGFGENAGNGENQDYYDDKIYNQRIQQFKANLNTDLNSDPSDDLYFSSYLLPPIRDCLEVNGTKLKSNDNYKEYTVNGQQRHIMEIGVPFHYQLGLRKGKTAYDKFIESFGPK
jgi:hypothetical protein